MTHKDDALQVKNAALRYRPAEATPAPAPPNSPGNAARPSAPREGGASRERRAERTVYVLPNGASRPQPAQIKTGISDGIVTEVLEGLKEGDQVITAELTATSATASPAANPFSGGARRFP